MPTFAAKASPKPAQPSAPHGSAAEASPSVPAVTSPGDPVERAADEMAEESLRTAVPPTAAQVMMRRPAGGAIGTGVAGAAEVGGAGAGTVSSTSPAETLARRAAGAGGEPLPGAVRGYFEPRFGRDLGGVRIHTGGEAAEGAGAVRARAYTLGREIVFGAGEWAPGTAEGDHLIAHEVAHVIQNAASAAGRGALLRRPVTSDLPSVAQFEWTGREQRKTTQRISSAHVSLSYEPTTGELTCTFRLRWRFPPTWPETRRAQYIEAFVNVVTSTWQRRFPLVKFEDGNATTTSAQVLLAFDSVRAPDMGNDTEFINWLQTPAGAVTRDRWTMNVHDSPLFRDQVDVPNVHLDSGSNVAQTAGTSSYSNRTYTQGPGGAIQAPEHQHYFDLGITPSAGTAPGGRYTQTASAHEFGHMIGLADEYVLSSDDYQDIVRARGKAAADAELRKRRGASARILNMGGDVTRDAYRPFADFLHALTAEDWRVQ